LTREARAVNSYAVMCRPRFETAIPRAATARVHRERVVLWRDAAVVGTRTVTPCQHALLHGELAHRSRQLFNVKRFCKASLDLTGTYPGRVRIRSSRDNDTREDLATGTRLVTVGEPTHARGWRCPIEHDDVWATLGHALDCVGFIASGQYLVTTIREIIGNHPLNPRVVADYENARQCDNSSSLAKGRFQSGLP
jgi:hypothetical protein